MLSKEYTSDLSVEEIVKRMHDTSPIDTVSKTFATCVSHMLANDAQARAKTLKDHTPP
jgi:hypothetical protein